MSLQLEPDGLVLSQPAHLVVPYEGSAPGSPDDVIVLMSSSANAVRDLGDEQTQTEAVAAEITPSQITTDIYEGPCGFVHLKGQHIFVGARRPNRSTTVEQGRAAVAAARGWIGSLYGAVGVPTKSVTGVTCAQLAEDAWERVPINMCYTPDPLLTPFNQFANTVPVDAITVDAKGGPVRLPIVVAVNTTSALSPFPAYGAAGSGPGRVPATVTVEVDDAQLRASGRFHLEAAILAPGVTSGPQAAQDLVFEPSEEEDLGKTYTFTVHVAAVQPATATPLAADLVMRVFIGRCGDRMTDPGEECDGNTPNTCSDGKTCNAACRCDSCGNAALDAGEACDRSAATPGAPSYGCPPDKVCGNDCTCGAAVCGNGKTEPGEQCDIGDNRCGLDSELRSCNTACECAVAEQCGNQVLDLGEQCDYRLGPGDCGKRVPAFVGYASSCRTGYCQCECPTPTTTDCATSSGIVEHCVDGTRCDPDRGCLQTDCPAHASFSNASYTCQCDAPYNFPLQDNCRKTSSLHGLLLECSQTPY